MIGILIDECLEKQITEYVEEYGPDDIIYLLTFLVKKHGFKRNNND